MMQRSRRAALAAETLALLQQGSYTTLQGTTVNIRPDLCRCLDGTRYFSTEDIHRIITEVRSQPPGPRAAEIVVANETTLSGVFALAESSDAAIGVLNFASARNPGGGFLNGAEAQEESLARSSALYLSQQEAFEFYERHRALRSCLYSDALVLSPNCPVIRDDSGALLARPKIVSMITCAAPNAGALAKESAGELRLVPETLRRRAEGVLAAAVHAGCRDLVLGAWGCGVFRNDARLVARVFADWLADGWKFRFRRIRFSIYDSTRERAVLTAFEQVVGSG